LASEVQFSFDGEDDVLLELRRIARRLGDEVGPALHDVGSGVLEESKRLVPIDTGALEKSGRVLKPKGEGIDTSVAIRYGGKKAWYAARVHETGRIDRSRGVKYLERPFLEAASTLPRDLARDLNVERL